MATTWGRQDPEEPESPADQAIRQPASGQQHAAGSLRSNRQSDGDLPPQTKAQQAVSGRPPMAAPAARPTRKRRKSQSSKSSRGTKKQGRPQAPSRTTTDQQDEC
jgi:hypothetical protein